MKGVGNYQLLEEINVIYSTDRSWHDKYTKNKNQEIILSYKCIDIRLLCSDEVG